MSCFGIDVSEHNGTLNWSRLKAAGVRYAIIRGGYGRNAVDGQFRANITGALAQGIPVGIYWFSYATNSAGAKQEARKCLETIRGYEIKLPVFFDFEYDTVDYARKQGVTLGRQAFNDHAVAFCEAVKAAGYTPGVYYNYDYYNRFVDQSRLGGYVQWYAQYAAKPAISGYDIWQYSSTVTLPGCTGRFDANTMKNTALLGGGVLAKTPAAADTKEEFDVAKTYRNGSTAEPVYADTARNLKIGSLNPWETCECLGKAGGMYIVRYQVDGTTGYKVGLVKYAGGVA